MIASKFFYTGLAVLLLLGFMNSQQHKWVKPAATVAIACTFISAIGWIWGY